MHFLLRLGRSEELQQEQPKWAGALIVFSFLWSMLLPAYAQTESPEKDSSASSSTAQIEASLKRLLALDAVREVAVFEDAQGKLLTVSRGQMLPGSNERLTRVFADSVELTRQNESQPLIYFLKIGESLPDKRTENLEAVHSKNRPVEQVTIHSIPIPETKSLVGHSSRP